MKCIPQSVVMKMFNLSTDQVATCIFNAGWKGVITSVECMGMLSGGAFVYKCEGHDANNKPLPKYIETFKVKVSPMKKGWLEQWKPEFRDERKARILNNEFVISGWWR